MHIRCIFLRVSRIIVNSLEIITKYSTKIYALITKNIWHIDKKLSFWATCQVKCNSKLEKISEGEFQLRHLRGR